MKRNLIALILLLAAGGLSAAPTARGRAATKAEIEVLRESLQERLKDADSAKFKDVYFGKGENSNTVCGLVNSKNSYGAYAGYSAFVGMIFPGTEESAGKPIGMVIGVDTSDSPVALTLCSNDGIM